MRKKNILFYLKHHIAIISIVSLSFVIICWLSTYLFFKNTDNEYRDSFGGMFGGIESLFSGFAFCVAIILQILKLALI